MLRLLPWLLVLASCARSKPPEAAAAAAAPTCPRADAYSPVVLPDAEFEARAWSRFERFSDHASSKELPFEACMVEGQLNLLTTLTCDDGSNPFEGDRGAAHDTRQGNVGVGGRCESVVDLYMVPCPEGPREVYIDMYLCRTPR